jgi:hypothetical protein
MNSGNMQPNNLVQASQTRNFIKRYVRSSFGKREILDEEKIKTKVVDKLADSVPSFINHIQEEDRNDDFFDSYFIGKHEIYENPPQSSDTKNKKEKEVADIEQMNGETDLKSNQEQSKFPLADINENVENEQATFQDDSLISQPFDKDVQNLHAQISTTTPAQLALLTTQRSELKDQLLTRAQNIQNESTKEKNKGKLIEILKNNHTENISAETQTNHAKEENKEEPEEESQDETAKNSEKGTSTNQNEKPSDLSSIIDSDSEKTIYESFYELLDDDTDSKKDPK